MADHIEGADFNPKALLDEDPVRQDLAIYTIRKRELKNLQGLDRLPLHSLEIRWLSSPDLNVVPFPPRLKTLMIWHSSKLRSLEGLEAAAKLENLALEDNGPLENAEAFRALKRLKNLSITGGFTATQKITSLDALEGLPIEKLTLRAVAGDKLNLSSVARLPAIRELDLHGPNFAPEELAKVAAAHPWFLQQLLNLQDYTLPGMRCKQCGGV